MLQTESEQFVVVGQNEKLAFLKFILQVVPQTHESLEAGGDSLLPLPCLELLHHGRQVKIMAWQLTNKPQLSI